MGLSTQLDPSGHRLSLTLFMNIIGSIGSGLFSVLSLHLASTSSSRCSNTKPPIRARTAALLANTSILIWIDPILVYLSHLTNTLWKRAACQARQQRTQAQTTHPTSCHHKLVTQRNTGPRDVRIPTLLHHHIRMTSSPVWKMAGCTRMNMSGPDSEMAVLQLLNLP